MSFLNHFLTFKDIGWYRYSRNSWKLFLHIEERFLKVLTFPSHGLKLSASHCTKQTPAARFQKVGKPRSPYWWVCYALSGSIKGLWWNFHNSVGAYWTNNSEFLLTHPRKFVQHPGWTKGRRNFVIFSNRFWGNLQKLNDFESNNSKIDTDRVCKKKRFFLSKKQLYMFMRLFFSILFFLFIGHLAYKNEFFIKSFVLEWYESNLNQKAWNSFDQNLAAGRERPFSLLYEHPKCLEAVRNSLQEISTTWQLISLAKFRPLFDPFVSE